jgi:terminase small subunit-like protein
MFRAWFSYPRVEVQARVIERLEAGATLRALAAMPGFPKRQTLHTWGKADPDFAVRLARARAWGRGLRTSATAGPVFDAVRAEALLVKVRLGEAVKDLVKRPEGPKRLLLNRWRRERPDFDADLKAAVWSARCFHGRRKGWPYDEAAADRIILRLCKGETMPQIMRDPAMPGKDALIRWRRDRPEFAGALKLAHRSGFRVRARARRQTPELLEAIVAHILRGGSVRSAAMTVPGAPNVGNLRAWLKANAEFARDVALANRMRDELILDSALELAQRATPENAALDAARFAKLRQRFGQLRGGRKPRGQTW